MKYYLLSALDGIRSPDIKNYNQVIHYRAFAENKSYKMAKRTLCFVKNEADFGDILLLPFPLFKKEMKESLDLFVWHDIMYKGIVFMEYDRTKSHEYYLPFFERISGGCTLEQRSGGFGSAMVILNNPIPDDMAILYLDTGQDIHVIARIDLIESFLRKGLCSVQLMPVDLTIGGTILE